MTERPILMADWTAKATLDGRKTETRRVLTKGTSTCEVPLYWLDFDDAVPDPAAWGAKGHGCLKVLAGNHLEEMLRDTRHRVYPRWFPGDLLYVRQAWAPLDGVEDPCLPAIAEGALFRADYPDGLPDDVERWRPSIHMPKRLARTWLRVESVHCERLQAMTQGAVLAEGIEIPPAGLSRRFDPIQALAFHPELLDAWRTKWDALNLARGFGWEANPWVWVLRYSLTERNG